MLHIPVSADDHLQGNPDAPIILVEYGDYECPHCGHAYPIIKQVQAHYGDRMGFVFRNFPLKEIHPYAEAAAESAEYAATKGKFWEMHDAIFENQADLSPEMLLALADSLDISSSGLEAALEQKEFAARVRNDFRGGVRSDVNGTPTFFINGHRYDGAPTFEDLMASFEIRLMRDRKD
ncbi:DsbA family protein [soil metagenome]